MKFNIKKIILVAFVVISFTPILVFAKETNKKLGEKTSGLSPSGGNFCGKINDLEVKYAEQIAKLKRAHRRMTLAEKMSW
jgi:hypothetical protein